MNEKPKKFLFTLAISMFVSVHIPTSSRIGFENFSIKVSNCSGEGKSGLENCCMGCAKSNRPLKGENSFHTRKKLFLHDVMSFGETFLIFFSIILTNFAVRKMNHGKPPTEEEEK